MFANRFLLAITPTARLRLDLGAILHHLLQRDQPDRLTQDLATKSDGCW
jgi:hypothetical protein